MHTLTIVGLSAPETISKAALDAVFSAPRLFLQSDQTPCALPVLEMTHTTMDDLYAMSEDFDELNAKIAERLTAALLETDVVYAVAGSGISDATGMLIKQVKNAGYQVVCLYGASIAQAAMASAGLSGGGYCVFPAAELPCAPDADKLLAVEEIDTGIRASEVKLYLMETYPDDHEVRLCTMDEAGQYSVQTLSLFEIDRQKHYHATSVLLVPPVAFMNRTRFSYRELVHVMHRLFSPGGCPWDAEQTHKTLKKNMLEECYEVLDAIDREDDDALVEELGDVLLQCVFHCEIAGSEGRFYEGDMCTGIVKKLIYRHPHIFGEGTAKTANEVLKRWEELKKTEKHMETQTQVLEAVPKNLPALVRASKVQKKAAQVGFDWENAKDALQKLEEETAELKHAMDGSGEIGEEMGDLLFSAVNVARLLRLESEELLQAASNKFIRRFGEMERIASKKGGRLEEITLHDQNSIWEQVKSKENSQK